MEKDNLRILSPSEVNKTKRDVKGEEYLEILKKVEKIVLHQKSFIIEEGIKGFIFYGDVGLGKTMLSKVLAYDLGWRLIFVDGSDIARPEYGESESQISKIFSKAKSNSIQPAVILIDDCESVFPTRDWMKGESWHVAQNNVFFHELDNLDTSKNTVILTTNRYDLVDKAVKDRLQNIEFPKPDKKALKEIAEIKMDKLKMKNGDKVFDEIEKGNFESVRDLEKFITEKYIEEVSKE
ncbi:MAG: AAA family ATPase [Elusimicrobiota bacterium]